MTAWHLVVSLMYKKKYKLSLALNILVWARFFFEVNKEKTIKYGITQSGKHEMTVNICGVIIAFTAQKETEACFPVLSTTNVFITFKF